MILKMYHKRKAAALLTLVCLLGTSIGGLGSRVNAADNDSWLISLNRPAYASSVNGGDIPSRATDGDIATQWGAKWESSNQWLDVDLGASANMDRFVIKWQNPMTYATNYKIQVSDDELNWTTIHTEENGDGGERIPDSNGNPFCVEEVTASGTGRYVRLYMPTCVSGFGVAIYEFEVYGKGGLVQKPKATKNLALNKSVTASSTAQPWWAGPGEKAAEKAVDGNYVSNWLSEGNNDEWFQVDLGQVYKVGQVNINWEVEFGRVYEIQTSVDNANWDVVYRQLNGLGEPEQITMYKDARYVKINGIAMGRGSGYSLRELEVLEYAEGDPKTNPVIENIPEPKVVEVGSGSYSIDDVTMAQPRTPKYITDNVKTPIPSNDWWTSLIYTRLSDGITALPYMFKYENTGLGMYYATDIFTSPNNGGMDTKSNNMDLVVSTSNILHTPEARVDGYGDWSVDVIFSDDATPKMKSTLIKGSPYVYHTFSDPNTVEISAQSIKEFFDDNNNPILVKDGDSIITDHIGIEVTNTNTAPVSKQQIHDYGIFVPEGTRITRLGSKLKIQLGSGQNYMSIGILTKRSDLNYMYQHAYAFIKDTTVSYNYDERTSNITTTFKETIDLKRNGFSNKTLIGLMPHQWKYSSNNLTDMKYSSARGTMKILEGNEFQTKIRFQGITPSFSEPTESGTYVRETMLGYLNEFKRSVTRDYWVADPYWQGKKTHPLSMGILIAEELGEYETRDEFISILRKIMENWLSYDGEDDYPYYMYYSPSWGTLNGQGGDHGMGINLSDHHFLWSYFTFPAAVLAAYDNNFVAEYGEMLEHLIRDSVNPAKDDALYPFMRNFDPYEGHSWAGGYGDNQSGNNQESASEATFAWAGLYLWGLVTGNNTYRDAGIWGFTSEVNAIEQYWFDYDGDNWAEDYTSGCVGMVWGSSYTNGTYFSGNPSCIYGIHMLPVTPVLTYMGYRPEQAARIYADYERDQAIYQEKVANEGAVDPEGWFHILWPFQANSNPDAVMAKWDPKELPEDERFNTYWYVQNMSAKGNRAVDVWSSNWTSYQVFKKGNEYNAVIWNPTNQVKYVEFCNESGKTGSAYVHPNTTLTVNPFKDSSLPNVQLPPAPKAEPEPLIIPGKIEAEDYYTNFSCSADVASEGGLCIGYIDDGDSLVYEVDVKEEADYTIEYRVHNGGQKPGQIQLKSTLSGSQVLSTVDIPHSDNWTTVTTKAHLKAGAQRIRVLFSKGGFNLNWLKVHTGDGVPEEGNEPGEGELKGTNIAIGKTATASSHIGGSTPEQAIDGNKDGTRWESEHTDNEWIVVDLGNSASINGVKLYWETAAGKNYKIQVSENGTDWKDAYTRTNGSGGNETLVFKQPMTGRYVKMVGTERTTGYGYSLWEFEIYGSEGEEAEVPPVPEDVTLTIEAENYSNMHGVAEEPCTEGGQSLGWIDTGDWMEYQINIPHAGKYTADLRVKAWSEAAALEVILDGKVLTNCNLYNGDTWSSIKTNNFTLPAGNITLRLKVVEGGFNFNWFQLNSVK